MPLTATFIYKILPREINRLFQSYDNQKLINGCRNLKKLDFVPLMLSLGPFAVYNILPQLNIYEGDVIFDGHIIERNEQSEITAYRFNESALSQFR
jgi:hypothetical protein